MKKDIITDAEFEERPNQLTKNLDRGTQIATCEEILLLAKNREAVWVEYWGKPIAAGFLANWQVCRLIHLLESRKVFRIVKVCNHG